MKNAQSEVILELTKKLQNLIGPQASNEMLVTKKADNSFVTEIDLFVSNLIKQKLIQHDHYKNFHFYSEEEFDELHFPAAILDPIDGTRELVLRRAECAVSLALMQSASISDPANYAWIYNPFSGFSLDSSDCYVNVANKSSKKLLGLVSRSEFEKGYFDEYLDKNKKLDLSPRGSIAFKLGLLAASACDFVISLSPKNIWDIAAGTVLCSQRGISLYQNGKKIERLDEVQVKGILLWCADDLALEIQELFQK